MHAIAGGVSCCAVAPEWGLLACTDCTLSGADAGGVDGTDGSERVTDRSVLAAGATVWPAVGICTAGLATGAGCGKIPTVAEKRVAKGAVGTNPTLADLPEKDSSHGRMLPDELMVLLQLL